MSSSQTGKRKITFSQLIATLRLYENVYTVYFLSPLITTDFRILDCIPKVVNEIIAFNNNNNNERQTL